MNTHQYLKLSIFDWAGTTVDHGSCAPALAFIEGFKKHGVNITLAQAREPMGMEKRDHIAAVGNIDEVKKKWHKVHGRAMNEADIDSMYQGFRNLLLNVLAENSAIISDVIETVAWLRGEGLKIGGSTGYFQEAADIVTAQIAVARRKLRQAGAHYVIDGMRELPQVIKDINYRLVNNDKS